MFGGSAIDRSPGLLLEPSFLQFIQKGHNGLLLATAVASGAFLLWPLVRKSAGGPSVGTLEATQLVNREDALFIDVRDAGEYSAGHILGARNIPVGKMDGSGELAKRKDKAIIVYCDGGNRAATAAAALRKLGFTRVVNLTGGIGAWQQAGLPVEKK
jgi:rhodanese-related sulfurtransferase